ncbi:MAG: GHKL domain-containing protein [Firmicutes bacterium]|nr:GHKL domain-containing protein [Bacillota bacterium]
MLEVISLITSCILQTISCAYVVGNLMNKKAILKSKSNILILIIVTMLFYSFMSIDMGISKPLLIYLIVIVAFKYFYDISFNDSVIVNFISMILNCIGEVIVTLSVVLFKTPQHVIDKYLVNTPISNIMVFICIVIILKLFRKQLLWIKSIMEKEKIAYIFYGILALGIALVIRRNYYWTFNKDFIINTTIIVIFVSIIISLFLEKYKTKKKTEEFNNMYEQVQSIKTLLNRYKKYNHENKNQLIVIRENSKGNKKVTEYIDSILNESMGHEDKWISELSYITDPGISGFLSVKINEMIDNGIKVSLIISPKVKNYKFEKINSKEYKEVCRVLGVYLDNAHEASSGTKKKEVTIEILIDDNRLLIIISNSYKGKIELDKLDKEGYTTKGKNHGVGLSLVSDIIKSNNHLEQKREIIKDYYFQYLYIKN